MLVVTRSGLLESFLMGRLGPQGSDAVTTLTLAKRASYTRPHTLHS